MIGLMGQVTTWAPFTETQFGFIKEHGMNGRTFYFRAFDVVGSIDEGMTVKFDVKTGPVGMRNAVAKNVRGEE